MKRFWEILLLLGLAELHDACHAVHGCVDCCVGCAVVVHTLELGAIRLITWNPDYALPRIHQTIDDHHALLVFIASISERVPRRARRHPAAVGHWQWNPLDRGRA